MRPLDLTGHRFGMLVALSLHSRLKGQAVWLCRCDCGVESKALLGNLRRGHTTSCGCQRSVATAQNKTRHAMHGTPTYRSWSSMLTRCINPANHKFADYGGRGIAVHETWKSFEGFYADMGERPSGTTLGRKDNDGNYEPGNCRWESAKQQGRNKRNTASFEHDGITATIPEHCERLGLNPSTVRTRIYTLGWPVAQALATHA
ncbi:hypothetical protein [Pseudomonas sp. Marseille-QA0892]